MVAQFLRLKLTLLGNTFRRSPVQAVGMVLGLLYGLGLAGFIAAGILALGLTTVDISRVVMVGFGSAVVLVFLLLPLVFGVDDTLDPRRFALFGIRNTRLAFSLGVAAFVSVPAVIITIFALTQIGLWARVPVAVPFALLAAIVIVPTCVLCARVTTALASLFLSSRRARDAAGIVLVLLLAIAAPLAAITATVDWQSQGLPVLRRIVSVVTWTPLGAAWSVPGDAALGDFGGAWLKLLIAVAFLVALAFAWRGLVALALVRPQREAAARRYSGLGWFERLPATPLGAIAARSLSYWGRDARYRMSLAVIPVVPIFMVVALLVAGVPVPLIAWVPVPVMCLFLGWSVHNDIAHDSTAFWAHVSASTKGTDDRWGRLVPALFVGLPVAVLGSVATALVVNDSTIIPGLLGLSLCVLFTALGISSVISAAFPYPAVRPGDSPFAQPQAAGTAGSVVQSLSFLVTLLLSAPVVLVLIVTLGSPSGQLGALGIGLVIGLAVLIGGVVGGGAIVNRRAPELLAFTLQN